MSARTSGPSGPLKIALAGAGMISWFHLVGWRNLGSRVRLVAVCDPDLAKAKARAREFGIEAAFCDRDAMLDAGVIDALDVASPRETHADWVEAAAARGIHVLCQKPLTPDLAQSEALVRRVGAHVRLMVHENWRFRPWYRELRRWIAAGEIGDITLARMAMINSGLLPDAEGHRPALVRQPFMQHEVRLMIAEVLIHHLDTMRYLCGEMRVLGARIGYTLADVRGETAAAIYLETAAGAPVEVSGTMAAPGYPARPPDRLEIVGTKASATFVDNQLRLLGPAPRLETYDSAAGYQASFDGVIAHFVDCLESGAPFETGPDDNLETLRLVEHAYWSAGMHSSPGHRWVRENSMNQNCDPQAALIGPPKTVIDTPALLVDLDVMEANIARILATCRKNGIAWRPHCKGHKSPDIAKREIAAGAIGITCAKLGEAEVMAAAGISDILIANQVVGAAKVERLMALLDKARVVVAVDSVANVEELARAAAAADKTAEVVIEVDVGMARAGLAPGAPTLALAKAIAANPGLRLVGLFTWESQATRIADPVEKERVVRVALGMLASAAKACADAGHSMKIVSCGGTGTFPYCAEQPGVTEIQAGGAIFSDVHYREHYHTDFAPALTILATVTSRPNATRIILDAGRKAMSCDTAMPAPLGLPPIAEIKLSAEHGKIELAAPCDTPRIGDRIELICGYSDSTVFLHDQIVAIRKGRIEAIWPLLARGKLT